MATSKRKASSFLLIALACLFSPAWGSLDSCQGVQALQCLAECPAGLMLSSENAKLCVPCSAGTYKNSSGNHDCALCLAGSYTSTTRSTSCNQCPAGSFASGKGASTCTQCPAGSFAGGKGSSTCTQCPAGSYASETGSSTCTQCPAGSFASNKGSSTCRKCPAGSYASETGSSTCTQCPAGSYASEEGSNACTKCSAGTYTNSSGNTDCAKCPPGTYSSTKGATECKNCDWRNSLKRYASMTKCDLCPDSLFSYGTEKCHPVRRLGCFKDDSPRDLPLQIQFETDNTPLRCAEYCKAKGYFYAGLQAGSYCFCGKSHGKYGRLNDSQCTLNCTGESRLTCGDHWKNEVYFTGLNDMLRVGCFKDDSPRDLPLQIQFETDNTPRRCADYCKSKGYLYAGMQARSYCFCGNSYGQYGQLTNSECAGKCTGDINKNCGAGMKNEVYFSGLNDPLRLGCYRDDAPRDLPHMEQFEVDNTPLKCAEYCRSKGYLYAGVQGNSYCLCGDSYGKYGQLSDSECNFKCTGDRTKNCGGSWKNDVYFSGITRQ